MKKIGGFMFFFGLISAIITFLGRELIILSWINMWGETIAWVIRGILIVGGGLMWLLGRDNG